MVASFPHLPHSSLAVQNLHRKPGTFYYVVLYITPEDSKQCRVAEISTVELEKPETGHACTTDYSSKLKMKNTKS